MNILFGFLFLGLGAITLLFGNAFNRIDKRLAQIEKKIDVIHSEWRQKHLYAYPTQYPFIEEKF